MRILIVDDEPNIRRTLRVALEAMGHAVGEAVNGSEALRKVERGRSTSPWSTSGSATSRGSTCSSRCWRSCPGWRWS